MADFILEPTPIQSEDQPIVGKRFKNITGFKTGTGIGQTTTATIITDVRDNAGQMQKKTQTLTFTNGLLTAKADESNWTDTTDI